jgi:Cupin-like domain
MSSSVWFVLPGFRSSNSHVPCDAACLAGSGQVPQNFSQVDLATMSIAEIGGTFPKFPVRVTGACMTSLRIPFQPARPRCATCSSRLTTVQGRQAARVVDLHAGQALYLPAGWFHEVCYFHLCFWQRQWSQRPHLSCLHPCSTADRARLSAWQVTSFSTEQQQGHVAFSYWFHPPDNLRPDASGLEQPYMSGFWPALWAARVPRVRSSAQPQLNGMLSSPPREDGQTAGAESAQGGTPPYLALPVYRLWWRHPSWIASCGRRRHQFLLMRRVRCRTS